VGKDRKYPAAVDFFDNVARFTAIGHRERSSPAERQKILVHNAAKLYGFD
jgi:predicted TIM-barrel fold metal-dependent hydrolase